MSSGGAERIVNGLRLLGLDDEPQGSGSVVAIHWGDYRRLEIWVSSGANIGNWYPLGGEFGCPGVAEDPRPELQKAASRERWQRPPGTIPLHPVWSDVLARGPAVLLVPGQAEAYADGWEAGRRRLLDQIEQLRDDEGVPPATSGTRAGDGVAPDDDRVVGVAVEAINDYLDVLEGLASAERGSPAAARDLRNPHVRPASALIEGLAHAVLNAIDDAGMALIERDTAAQR